MSLLRLPTEITFDILDTVLHGIGIRRTLLLRIVSRLFRDAIHSGVFALPTFESSRYDSASPLARDPLMAQPLVLYLLLYKLKSGNSNARPLCHTIHQVAAFLKNSVPVETSIKHLATLASIEMNLHEIASSLEPGTECSIADDELLNYALIVASQEGILSLAKSLCSRGSCVVHTRFFGSAVAAAARYGHTDVVIYLLGQHPSEFQFMMALEGAASFGRFELVNTLLKNRVIYPSSLYDHITLSSFRRDTADVATLLLSARKPFNPKETLRGGTMVKAEEEFQINLLRTAVQFGNVELITKALDNDIAPSVDIKTILLQDSCRFGHSQLIELLLSKGAPASKEALFWATYSGAQGFVDQISSKLPRCALYDALAAAYSVKNAKMIDHLLQKLDSPSRAPQFHDLIDRLVAGNTSDTPVDQCLLQLRPQNILHFLLASREPSSWQHYDSPSFLAYHSHFIRSSSLTHLARHSKSIATLQICYHQGWDINQECSPLLPPPLSHVIMDEQTVIWYLEHGADPNASCMSLKTTPMSTAILEASLSIILRLFNKGAIASKGQLLHWAVRRNDKDSVLIIDMLIRRGADVNERKKWEGIETFGLGTPLHTAVTNTSTEPSILRALLERGADRKLLDSRARTPLQKAEEVGFNVAIELLR